jgi:hypothetical protein
MMNKEVYLPTEIAKMLHVSPHMVRIACKQHAPGWDFPFFLSGNRVKIPVESFNRWYESRFGKLPEGV